MSEPTVADWVRAFDVLQSLVACHALWMTVTSPHEWAHFTPEARDQIRAANYRAIARLGGA